MTVGICKKNSMRSCKQRAHEKRNFIRCLRERRRTRHSSCNGGRRGVAQGGGGKNDYGLFWGGKKIILADRPKRRKKITRAYEKKEHEHTYGQRLGGVHGKDGVHVTAPMQWGRRRVGAAGRNNLGLCDGMVRTRSRQKATHRNMKTHQSSAGSWDMRKAIA